MYKTSRNIFCIIFFAANIFLLSFQAKSAVEIETESGRIKVSFSLFNLSGYPIAFEYAPQLKQGSFGSNWSSSLDTRVIMPGKLMPIYMIEAYADYFPFLKDSKGSFIPANEANGKLEFNDKTYKFRLLDDCEVIYDSAGFLKSTKDRSGGFTLFKSDSDNLIEGWKTYSYKNKIETQGSVKRDSNGNILEIVTSVAKYVFNYKNALLRSIYINGIPEYEFEYTEDGALSGFREAYHDYTFEYYEDKKIRSIEDVFGDSIYVEYSREQENGKTIDNVYVWNITRFLVNKYKYSGSSAEITETPIDSFTELLSGKIDNKNGSRNSSTIAGDTGLIEGDGKGGLSIESFTRGFSPYKITSKSEFVSITNKNGYDLFKEIVNINSEDVLTPASGIKFNGVIRDTNNNILAVISNGIISERYTYTRHGESKWLPESIITATGNKYSLKYDNQDRLIESSDTLGRKEIFSYNENGYAVTYPDGAVSSFINNEIGLPVEIRDPLDRVTRIEYGNSLTPESVELVGFDRQQVELFPDEGISSLESRLFGSWNFIEGDDMSVMRVAPDDTVTQFVFDKDNLLISISDADGRALASYSYTDFLQLAKASSENCTINFSYDENGRLTGKKYEEDGLAVKFDYDSVDMISKISDSDKFSVRYKRNASGLITEISADEAGVFNAAYYSSGLLKELFYPNGVTISWVYDAAGRITSYTLSFPGGSKKETKIKYDKVGRVSETESGGSIIHYSFDQLGYLSNISDAKGKSLNISFDKWGNLEALGNNMSKGSNAACYTEINALGLDYTNESSISKYKDGNRSAEVKYDWNKNIKNLSFSDSREIKISYEPVGWRPYRILTGEKEKRYYFVYGRLYAVWDSESKGLTRYIYFPGTDICLAVIRPDKTIHYTMSDVLGSITDISDKKANIINSRKFNIFGSVIGQDTLDIATYYGGKLGIDDGNIIFAENGPVLLKAMRYFSGRARMPNDLEPDYENKLSFMEDMPIKSFNNRTTLRPSGVNSRQL